MNLTLTPNSNELLIDSQGQELRESVTQYTSFVRIPHFLVNVAASHAQNSFMSLSEYAVLPWWLTPVQGIWKCFISMQSAPPNYIHLLTFTYTSLVYTPTSSDITIIFSGTYFINLMEHLNMTYQHHMRIDCHSNPDQEDLGLYIFQSCFAQQPKSRPCSHMSRVARIHCWRM